MIVMTLLKPKALQAGDTIALVSPASPVHDDAHVSEEMLELSRKRLHDMGFKTVLSPNALKLRGYLAGTDEERAKDLNQMFEDPDVDGIICIQGGYGSLRILPLLDYDLIKRNPKVFVGYSDITGLHCAISKMTGMVTFHGPMAGFDISKEFEYSKEWFSKAVSCPEPLGKLINPHDYTPMETITAGTVTGRLVGGNLSLLAATLGTPYEVDTSGRILLMEEVSEVPYRFDRMLTQLKLAGKLDDAAGFIIGECVDCEATGKRPSLNIREILGDLIEPLGKPAVYGLAAGHGKYKMTLPLGVRATVNAAKAEVIIEESGVRL